MRDKILELIEKHPKHFSKMIQSSFELIKWITENSKINPSCSWVEHIYSSLHNESNICPTGNTRLWNNIKTGWKIGCGKASECQCVRERVSDNVSKSKAKRSDDAIKAENLKREVTNLTKYGVKNIGQSQHALEKHREFYSNETNVNDTVTKQQQTMIERYGVNNAQQVKEFQEKSKKTMIEKYGVGNAFSLDNTKKASRDARQKMKIEGHNLLLGYNKFSNHVRTNHNFELLTSIEEYKGIQQRDAHSYLFKCLGCGYETSHKYYHARGIRCDYCNPSTKSFSSAQEMEIFEYVTNTLGIKGKPRDRSLINPYELDMIFPDHKVAIEYCGLYWHSERGGSSGERGIKYHSNKMNLVQDKGYRLITIFSDEWEQHQDIVKSRLSSIFGVSHRIYGRNCVVKQIDYQTSKTFTSKNHIQGHAAPKVSLGLFYNDELVSVMTFSGMRIVLNSKIEDNTWELLRFSTKLNTTIIGGASKLLKEFIRTYNPKKIISYADLRWSHGGVYERLGFIKTGKPTIGYWYIGDHYSTRHHRFKFRKVELVKNGADSMLTEWQIMQNLGYDRIWDCGQQKYVLSLL